jgi:thioredoxin reductase (NADPH)
LLCLDYAKGAEYLLRVPVRLRAALLATGTTDSEPTMPYLAEAVRSGALGYCPICDGYEVIGQAVGVITNRAAGASEALYLRDFTDRLTLFVVSPDIAFPP